uniref:serine--tRNA ligase n=1 Tax=Steinernema glaseri TaxID=37863 RepID=A0A1I7YZ85_9BILA
MLCTSRFTFSILKRFACTSAATLTRSPVRPDLDFEYLLDEANLPAIKQNIASRKGIGDIDAVHSAWKEISNFNLAAYEDVVLAEARYVQLWDKLYEEALLIPNFSHSEAPEGDESAARTVKTLGPKKREGRLLTAESLVKGWRSLFFPTAVAGNRSYAFLGGLSNLEKQLLDYAFKKVVARGFRPVTVPDLVEKKVTAACGLVQRSGHTNIQYVLNDHPDTCLSGTAEMGISALVRDRIVREEDLPLRLVAVSRCFRPEVSKSAAEARLYRVHEFTKVEMFVVCKPEESDNELDAIVDVQSEIFEHLGLHCRLLDMPTQELGAPASRKFDIEAWMPGRKIFGEVSSASNCTDFQARRLNLSVKAKDGSRYHAHTCNGTAIASTRAMVAVLETFQTKSKGLQMPDCLGKSSRTKPLRQQVASPFSYSFGLLF